MLENFRTQKIIWDRANRKIFETIEANSGDSNGRKLVVQIINQEVTESLSGTTLSLGWKSRNGAKGLDAFNVVDASKGVFEIYYTTEMLSNIGNIEASLILINSTGRIESSAFTISIRPSTVDDESVESENSFTALTEALVKVNDFDAQLAQKASQNDLEIEQARINNIVASGTITEGNTELIDIRVGADGKTYANAGDAVRTQYDKVTSNLARFKDYNKFLSLDKTFLGFLKIENAYCGSTGYINSSTHDSYEIIIDTDTTLFFESFDTQYTSLCVFTSGVIGGSGYTRYRHVAGGESTIPIETSKVTLPANSIIVVSVSKAQGNFILMENGDISGFYLANDIKLNTEQINQLKTDAEMYHLEYINDILTVGGYGIDCVFNDLTFTAQHGLFELQNLTYNGDIIFGTNNDYIGPVRVNGEPIKGGKHDGEVTDSVLITTDKGALTDGQTVEASKFTVFVKSHISDEFSRISSYSFDGNTMTTHSIITTLKNLQIDYIFGAGIISCQDDVNIAWLNKQELTTDVLIGLNEQTSIVCRNGTLISKRLSVNSSFGDSRVAFNVYTGRKKLYYYTCYGNNIAVPTNTVFASCAELIFS